MTAQTNGTDSVARFADLFTTPLPQGLREDAINMSAAEAFTVYGRSAGPLRLGRWGCTDTARPAGRLGPQPRNFSATIAFGDRVATASAVATGPVAALTEMLHRGGVTVEMLAFHQLRSGANVATFVRGSNGSRAAWAMGWDGDGTESALRAVIACANRLSG